MVYLNEEDLEHLICEEEAKELSTFKKFKNAIAELFTNRTSTWTLIAGSLKFFGGYCLASYKPTYFQAVYPSRDSDFGVINAAMASSLCFVSALAGGLLADHYRDRHMVKAWICILSSVISAPALAVCFLKQDSFELSVSMLGVNYLFAEAWGSPAITMLMDCTSSQNIGFAVSAYLFMTTISGMVSTALLGLVQVYLDAPNNVSVYGTSLNWFMMFAQIGCIPFFYLAGLSYTKAMKQREANLE